MSYEQLSLGQIAAEIPGATALFRQYKLDFCCGGAQTLADSVAKAGLDLAEINQALAALAARKNESTDTDWTQAPFEEMVPFIIKRYHERHREQIQELMQLAEKVERVHADKADCPKGLHDVLGTIWDDLGMHMMKEEHVLFPMILAGNYAMAQMPIRMMEAEHEEQGDLLVAVNRITNNLTLPEGACNTWRSLYAGLDEFMVDLTEHIHLENNILFPRVIAAA